MFTDHFIYFLGNWDPSTQEKRYSTKMPLRAMRVLAGFGVADMHWLKRDVDVPDCLKKQIFPWIEEEVEKLKRYHDQPDTTHRYTACCFLDYLKALRTVILQDAAAMMILHPERAMHRVFDCHKVFKSPEFLVREILSFCRFNIFVGIACNIFYYLLTIYLLSFTFFRHLRKS